MLKLKFSLHILFVFTLFTGFLTICSLENNILKRLVKNEVLFDAKLFINKQKMIKKSIQARDYYTFAVTLKKLENFERFYGKLTYKEKITLLEFIKKEYKGEKNILKNVPVYNKRSLTKKAILIGSMFMIEAFLLQHLSSTPPISTLPIYDALCKYLKKVAAITNLPIIIVLNIWAISDFLNYDVKNNITKLKLMKIAIKNMI